MAETPTEPPDFGSWRCWAIADEDVKLDENGGVVRWGSFTQDHPAHRPTLWVQHAPRWWERLLHRPGRREQRFRGGS